MSKKNTLELKEMSAYIIVNDTLKMSKGKIASQSAHGILSMHRFLLGNNINHLKWLSNGEKIVVVKTSQEHMQTLLSEYNDKLPTPNTLNLFPIYDAGRTEVESGSLTVIVSTPISDDKKPDWLKELKLL
jgi:PTH2 family peptidyl-tRNA hydrolase